MDSFFFFLSFPFPVRIRLSLENTAIARNNMKIIAEGLLGAVGYLPLGNLRIEIGEMHRTTA